MKKNLLLFSLLLALFACNNEPKPEPGKPETESQTPVTVSEAIERYNDSIANDSTNAMLYLHRAKAYLANEQVGAAMIDINKSLQIDPNNVDTYLLLANVYYMLGDESNINATLNRAAEIAPLDTRPMVKLAELNLLQQNYKLAAAYVDKALKTQSYNPQAYFVKGMYFIMAQQDTANALKNFQRAAEQDENFYDPVEQICRIYVVQEPPYTLEYLRKVQQQFPDHANSRYELALYLQSHGEPEEAVKHYDTLLMQNPENYIVLYNLGYVHLVYTDHYDVALDYFNRVLELKPDYLDAIFNKGHVYELMGDFAKATDIYKEVLKVKPNYNLAIEGLQRIQNQFEE